MFLLKLFMVIYLLILLETHTKEDENSTTIKR